MWRRWVALVALFMAGVMGTAEAAHVHGDWLPHADHRVHAALDHGTTAGGEEHCPICVAMHSAMPAALVLTHFVSLIAESKLIEGEVLAPKSRWNFAMFSRPPPVAELS